jgi:type IV pilus assembly protein PilA
VPRKPSTHTGLNDRQLEIDGSESHHWHGMMRQRLVRCAADERGFTLIEVLVVIILVGILAAIALAVFLRQEDKGRDASAKSDVTNLVRQVQQCNAGRADKEDFRDCDTAAKIGQTGLPVSADAPTELPDGTPDCSAPTGSETVSPPGTVRVLEAGKDCFVVYGISTSGNHFWYVKHAGGGYQRDCTTRNVNGCPADGNWAG